MTQSEILALIPPATDVEITSGTSTSKYVSPAGLKNNLNSRQLDNQQFNKLAFDLKSVANLQAWYDVTDVGSMTYSLSTFAVSQLNDKSGNARHLTQATGAAQPILANYGGARDYPYLPFSTTKNMLNASVVVSLPFTVYMVVKMNSFTNSAIIVAFSSGLYGICERLDDAFNGIGTVHPSGAYKGNRNLYKTDFALLKITFNSTASVVEINNELRPPSYGLGGTGEATAQIKIGGAGDFYFHEFAMYSGAVSDTDDKKIKERFMEKYGLANYPYLAVYADSIGLGTAATTATTNGFTQLTAAEKSMNIYNFAIAGTGVYRTTVTDFTKTYNNTMFANNGYIVIMYGTNDYSTLDATWKAVYKSIVSKFIYYGYTPSKILMCTPPYLSTNVSGISTIRTYLTDIATQLGTQFIDMATYMAANGGDTLMTGIHPTTAGHRVMADYLKTFIS